MVGGKLKILSIFLFLILPLYDGNSQTITYNTMCKAIDGDTMMVGKLKIRLAGIDAPELKQFCQDKNNQKYPCGLESQKFLENILHNAQDKTIKCEVAGMDKYRRVLAKCTIDNQDIQAMMVLNGQALAYTRYSADYADEQEIAISAKIGIWRGSLMNPEDFRHGENIK